MKIIAWYDPTSHTLKVALEKNALILKKSKIARVIATDTIRIALPEDYEVERTLERLYLQGCGEIALAVSPKGDKIAFLYDERELERVLQRIQRQDKNLAEVFRVVLNIKNTGFS